jgi:hypothetical protein
MVLQSSHQSSVEPNAASFHRNDSSILVIAAPLNNVMEQGELQQQHHHHQQHQQQQHAYNCVHRQQSQIVANIENNSMNYELDGDDISYSQISFKHHLRHDEGTSSRGSLHNVYDNTSVSTTNTSATTRNQTLGDNDSNFHRIIPGLEEVKEHDYIDERRTRYNDDKICTSMFVENQDILGDQNYPKISHSTLLLPTSTSMNSASISDDDNDERYRKKFRRYSDTKLLNKCNYENEFLINKTNVFGSPTKKTMHFRQPQSSSGNNLNDLIFERADDFDPIELNIQTVLEMDINHAQLRNNNNNNNNNRSNKIDTNDNDNSNSSNKNSSADNVLSTDGGDLNLRASTATNNSNNSNYSQKKIFHSLSNLDVVL